MGRLDNLNLVIVITGTILLFAQCNNSDESESTDTLDWSSSSELKEQGQAFVQDYVSDPNVLQVAIKSKDHSTLVAGVQAADLENALVNAGPLMVFAPTNVAFNALQEGTLESLLKPANKDKLANILKYHVTQGNYSKDFLKKFKKLEQANNQNAMVEVQGEYVYVGGAKIITNVPATNGIVHVIDKVMLPPED